MSDNFFSPNPELEFWNGGDFSGLDSPESLPFEQPAAAAALSLDNVAEIFDASNRASAAAAARFAATGSTTTAANPPAAAAADMSAAAAASWSPTIILAHFSMPILPEFTIDASHPEASSIEHCKKLLTDLPRSAHIDSEPEIFDTVTEINTLLRKIPGKIPVVHDMKLCIDKIYLTLALVRNQIQEQHLCDVSCAANCDFYGHPPAPYAEFKIENEEVEYDSDASAPDRPIPELPLPGTHALSDDYFHTFDYKNPISINDSNFKYFLDWENDQKRSFYSVSHRRLNDIIVINQDIRTWKLRCKMNSHFAKISPRRYFQRHTVVIASLILRPESFYFPHPELKNQWISEVQQLRKAYRYKPNVKTLPDFTTQADDPTPEPPKSFLDLMSEYKDIAFTSLRDLYNAITAKLSSIFSSIFGVVSTFVGSMISKIMDKIVDILIYIIEPEKRIKGFVVEKFKSQTHFTLAAFVFIIACTVAGILSVKFIFAVVEWMFPPKNLTQQLIDDPTLIDLEPQSASPITATVAVVAGVIGLGMEEKRTLTDRLRQFTILVSAGLAATTLAASFFTLLPVALQTSIQLKFGTPEQKEMAAIDLWLKQSTSLIRMSKLANIATTESYYDLIIAACKEALILKGKLKTPSITAIFLRNYSSLITVLANLTQLRESSAVRILPFTMHISGVPGVGKTLLVNNLIRNVYSIDKDDVYTRPLSDDYWNAWNNQSVIFYDEFGVGSKEEQTRIGLEFLEISSTKAFQPPQASVDSYTVGIKGGFAKPIGVVTSNNDKYFQLPEISQDALDRRRHANLRLTIHPDYEKYLTGNSIDLAALSPEERASAAWIQVTFYAAQATHQPALTPPMTYAEAIVLLKNKFESHIEFSRTLDKEINGPPKIKLDPKQLLDQMVAELSGIPEKLDPTEALLGLARDAIIPPAENNIADQTPTPPLPVPTELPQAQGPNDPDEALPGKTIDASVKKELITAINNAKNPVPNRIPFIFTFPADKGYDQQIGEWYTKISKMRQLLSKQEAYAVLLDLDKLYKAAKSCKKPTDHHHKFCELVATARDELVSKISVFVEEVPLQRPDPALSPEIDYSVGTSQGSIIALADHSNVNPTRVHRHYCFACGRQFAHKHDTSAFHDLTCPRCPKNKFSTHLLCPAAVESFTDLLGPDFIRIEELTPNQKCALNRQLLTYYFQHCRNFLDLPLVIPCGDLCTGDGCAGCHDALGKGTTFGDALKFGLAQYATIVTMGLATLALLMAVRSAFTGSSSPITFWTPVTQSAVPKHSSAKNKYSDRRIVKTGTSVAHSGEFPTALITIDRYELHAIPIQDKYFLTYRHVLNSLMPKDGTPVSIKISGKTYETTYQSSACVFPADDDLFLIGFPHCRTLPALANHTKKFITDDELDGMVAGPAIVLTASREIYTHVSPIRNMCYTGKDFSDPPKTTRWTVERGFFYNGNLKKGDCGSVLFSTHGNTSGKIIGLHVAGGSTDKPFGLSIAVTKELVMSMVKQAIAPSTCDLTKISFTTQAPLPEDHMDSLTTELSLSPNVKEIQILAPSARVHIKRKTNLQPSILAPDLWPPEKVMPLMSPDDPRSQNKDPLHEMLKDTAASEFPLIRRKLVVDAATATVHYLKRTLKTPLQRELTFEEACCGVPGILSSVNTNTSPGHPLIKIKKKPGKKDFFWFEDGVFNYNPSFKERVMDAVQSLREGKAVDMRYLVYLKDELTSQSKVDQGRCRLIYSGDVTYTIAFRMLFGNILAMFNNSGDVSTAAIGLNQYSHDMETIHHYLTRNGCDRFLAGDFKNFDKRTHPAIAKLAYGVISTLVLPGLQNAYASFLQSQINSPAQADKFLINFNFTHMSGLFLTTIINCVGVEIMTRAAFASRAPQLVFDENVKLKSLGDDHIISVTPQAAALIKPYDWKSEFETFGHVYTSADKTKPLDPDYQPFDEITFLGTEPVLVEGRWCGKARLSTLNELPLWTRDKNLTLLQNCTTFVELLSLHDTPVYEEKLSQLNSALLKNHFPPLQPPTQCELKRVVAARTASTGYLPFFEAQGPTLTSDNTTPSGSSSTSVMTEGNTSKTSSATSIRSFPDPKNSVSAKDATLVDATSSFILRDTFTWTTSAVSGTVLKSYDIPFGLLSTGETRTVQNMSFERFLYFYGEPLIKVTVTGTPFQSGHMIAYFLPLDRQNPEPANRYSLSQISFSPAKSSSGNVPCAFRFPRNLLNTLITSSPGGLGRLIIAVSSRLTGSSNTDDAIVTVSSAFLNPTFSIPRPLPAPGVALNYVKNGVLYEDKPRDLVTGSKLKEYQPVVAEEPSLAETQGQQQSTVNNSYTITNTAGTSLDTGALNSNTDNTGGLTASADLSAPMPFHNPPNASGSIPVLQQFGGMSTCAGVRNVADLQLHPATMYLEGRRIFDSSESKIASLLGTKCLLTTLSVSATSPSGTRLLSLKADSEFGVRSGSNVPINIAILNQFKFFRADVVYDFVLVGTEYHSCRLLAVAAYGTETISNAQKNVHNSALLDFSEGNLAHPFEVPYNSQTEYLCTSDGFSADATLDSLHHSLTLFLETKLKAPQTVAQNIELQIFISFKNVKVSFPRGESPYSWQPSAPPPSDFVYTIGYVPVSIDITGSNVRLNGVSGDIVSSITSGALYLAGGFACVRIFAPNDDRYLPLQTIAALPGSKSLAIQSVTINTNNSTFSVLLSPIALPILNPVRSFYALTLFIRARYDNLRAEAQGPEMVGVEEFETAEPVVATATASSSPVAPPCEITFGHHFDSHVTDVTEINRRFIRHVPELDLFPFRRAYPIHHETIDGRTTAWVVPVTNPNNWSALFMGWSGSLIYRVHSTTPFDVFFDPSKDFSTEFQPGLYADANIGTLIGIPQGAQTIGTNAFRVAYDSSAQTESAREKSYPLSDKNHYLQSSIPFATHYNFLACDPASRWPCSPGNLVIRSREPPEIYVAAGDDFALGVFVPPAVVTRNTEIFKAGINGMYHTN